MGNEQDILETNCLKSPMLIFLLLQQDVYKSHGLNSGVMNRERNSLTNKDKERKERKGKKKNGEADITIRLTLSMVK